MCQKHKDHTCCSKRDISKLTMEREFQKGLNFWYILFTDVTQAPRTGPGVYMCMDHIVKIQLFVDSRFGSFSSRLLWRQWTREFPYLFETLILVFVYTSYLGSLVLGGFTFIIKHVCWIIFPSQRIRSLSEMDSLVNLNTQLYIKDISLHFPFLNHSVQCRWANHF